jgi:poly-gamma-glutamate capsule biosynthesis protein CapA/YwtB (metallophosphatase superfamily)
MLGILGRLSNVSMMATHRTFNINLMGDVMLGRLIDQLFPMHVDCAEEARIVDSFRGQQAHLKNYGSETPWGNTLPLIRSGDLNVINLETSVTINERKWPNKVFNYRMHPENIQALKVAKIDYVSLANNHTLDFSEDGLTETVKTMKKAGIAFAGACETADEAQRPAELDLPRSRQESPPQASREQLVHLYSFSDHPQDWGDVTRFNLIDYTEKTRKRLKQELTSSVKPSLKIVSVHWGPNYRRSPSDEIKSLAHFFIDECGVDLIHGHSSHHIQGVEVYKGRLILYGCGDFVDDYAVNTEWRNDLSALWRVSVLEEAERLKIKRLEVFPNRIKAFQAGLLRWEDADHNWLTKRFRELCTEMGTKVDDELGADGQIVIEIP